MIVSALTTSHTPLSFLTPSITRRTFKFWNPFVASPKEKPTALTEEFLKKKPKAPQLRRGALDSSSILEDEAVAGPKPNEDEQMRMSRNPETMAAALDPRPDARMRWERKMVIRQITRRGRLSRTQLLKRTERELVSKSHDFQTSVKKLQPLATQIVGKTVEEAIVQMRFSKKKAAKDVKEHLEHAKNEAIVRRGMGLGLAEDETFQAVKILTKDGKKVKVRDPSTMYVDQAWVGRGLYGSTPDYRARGQMFMMKNPTTCKLRLLVLEHPANYSS